MGQLAVVFAEVVEVRPVVVAAAVVVVATVGLVDLFVVEVPE